MPAPDSPESRFSGAFQDNPFDPFDGAARKAQLRETEEEIDREGEQKLAEASYDLTSRGIAAEGRNLVCYEILQMARRLIDAALKFDKEASVFELNRLRIRGVCDNPFREERERETFEIIAARIDRTASWIRSHPESKQLWNVDPGKDNWGCLCQAEKERVARRLKLEYGKRRAAFELEASAVKALPGGLPPEETGPTVAADQGRPQNQSHADEFSSDPRRSKACEPIAKVRNLKPCEKKAYSQYMTALKEDSGLKDDDEVYDWVQENLIEDERLPARATWKRYVRTGRRFNGTQKNTARSDRPLGRSIARQDQI